LAVRLCRRGQFELGKLVRDLTGYIKMNAGGKPDPVRDDFVLQVNQLLSLAGL